MYRKRVEKLQNLVAEQQCDAYIVEDPISLFYLTGIEMSAGRYVVTPQEAHLFVDGRYLELCREIPGLPIEEGSLDQYGKVGFSKETTTVARSEKLGDKGVPFEDLVAKLREIKDETELALLREAGELGSKGYDYLCSLITEGATETELAMELDIFWKRSGGKGVAFDPIVAFGASSSMPHYHPRKTALKKGNLVLLDIGVSLNHYQSDMTRVVLFGDVDPELKKIYEIVRNAQKEALKVCRPGTRIGDLDAAARDLITAEGYGEQFCHRLGHGIGLEVHEAPSLCNKTAIKERKLQRGMVITVEPGIYLPGKGGVRLEDTVAITDDGYENLTNRPIDPY